MSPPSPRLIVTALVLAPLLVLGGGVLFRADGGSPAAGSAAPQVLDGTASGTADPDEQIRALQQRVQRLPGDWPAWTALGTAYLGQARRVDPTLFDEAAAAFDRSLQVRPDGNADALTGMATLAGARHDFACARDLARQAVAADPYDAAARGALSDALVQLGDYDAGFAQTQRMLDLRPDVASYTRASYALELQGDTEGARAAMQRALTIAASPSDAAFAAFQSADLAFDRGDLDTAAADLAAGLQRDPASPDLQLGLARVHAARGEQQAALDAYGQVVAELPHADHLVEYGEYLESIGRSARAREQYSAADAAIAAGADAGVLADVEVVRYYADHGRPDEALRVAQVLAAGRRSIDVEDAYAWALHAAGRDAEALDHARAAQRLGTRDALSTYHRGIIEAALGMTGEATASLQEALDLNPAFSPRHVPIAQRTLADLEGAG